MAKVSASGPFSIFPNVDRQLAVLTGRLSLTVEGRSPLTAAEESEVISFAGDVPAWCDVNQGPVLDLNPMTRRSRATGRLRRLCITAPRTLSISGTALILSRTRNLPVTVGRRHLELEMDDAVLVRGADPKIAPEPETPTTLFLAEVGE
jgi:hypothetical protein